MPNRTALCLKRTKLIFPNTIRYSQCNLQFLNPFIYLYSNKIRAKNLLFLKNSLIIVDSNFKIAWDTLVYYHNFHLNHHNDIIILKSKNSFNYYQYVQ